MKPLNQELEGCLRRFVNGNDWVGVPVIHEQEAIAVILAAVEARLKPDVDIRLASEPYQEGWSDALAAVREALGLEERA